MRKSMKKMVVMTLCAVMTVTAAGCGKKDSVQPSAETQTVGIANPFKDCASVEEAGELAGFDFTVPESLEGYGEPSYSAIENDLAQVIYRDGDDNRLLIRKAAGNDDISGDYNDYPEINTVSVGGLEVTVKGNDGKMNVAIWTNDGYTFAIMADNAVSWEEAAVWVQAIQ